MVGGGDVHNSYWVPCDDPDKAFWELDYWVDREGNTHQIEDMETSHLENVVNYIFNRGFGRQFADSKLESVILAEFKKREVR